MWKIVGAKIHQLPTLFRPRALKPKTQQWVEDYSSPTAQSFNSETIDSDPEPFSRLFHAQSWQLSPTHTGKLKMSDKQMKTINLFREIFLAFENISHIWIFMAKRELFTFFHPQPTISGKETLFFQTDLKPTGSRGDENNRRAADPIESLFFARNWNLHRRKKWFLCFRNHPEAGTCDSCLSARSFVNLFSICQEKQRMKQQRLLNELYSSLCPI